ncbi:MAG: universal stress protein [Desulfuromonadales bacterium]|nr:universal stress protein [Desulfuromonadales bacterium]
MPRKILIPVDESETSHQTSQAVIANQDLMPSEIILLHVVDVHLVQRLVPDIQKNMVYEAAEKSGKRILEKLAKPFQDAGFAPKLLLELGTPGKAILKVVEEKEIQLVIIGRHPGGGGLRDIMFGSVANHVVHAVKCPVLLI